MAATETDAQLEQMQRALTEKGEILKDLLRFTLEQRKLLEAQQAGSTGQATQTAHTPEAEQAPQEPQTQQSPQADSTPQDQQSPQTSHRPKEQELQGSQPPATPKASQTEQEALDLAAVNELLTERRRRMEEVDRLDREFLEAFQALKQQWKVESLEQLPSDALPPESFRKLQQQVAQVQKLLQAVQQVDEENRHRMETVMKALQGDIHQLRQGKKAVNRYSQKAGEQSSSIFLNKKEKS